MAEETKATTPAAPAPAADSQQQAKKPAAEKQTNCLACNKPIKKLKHYYRDGKFYCNKKCWKQKTKAKETKEA